MAACKLTLTRLASSFVDLTASCALFFLSSRSWTISSSVAPCSFACCLSALSIESISFSRRRRSFGLSTFGRSQIEVACSTRSW